MSCCKIKNSKFYDTELRCFTVVTTIMKIIRITKNINVTIRLLTHLLYGDISVADIKMGSKRA